MTTTKRLLSLFVSCAALTGCAVPYHFFSQLPLGDGIAGKSWQTVYKVDAEIINPSSLPLANTRLVNDFAAARYGTTLQLAATFYDPATGTFKGYGRKFVDGTGWSAVGPDFAVIASVAGGNLGHATIAEGPGGMFLAAFANSSIAMANPFLTAVHTGSWQPAQTSTPTAMIGYELSWGAFNTGFDSNYSISAAFDSLGRAYLSYLDVGVVSYPRVVRWDMGGGITGAATDLVEVSVPQLEGWVHARTVHDGSSHVCMFFDALEATGPVIRNVSMNCIDLSAGTPAPAAARTALSSGGYTIAYDAATNASGTIVVAYVDQGVANHVYANIITDGSAAAAVQLDAAMPTGWEAYLGPTLPMAQFAGATVDQGLRVGPSVTYIGNSQFMAAWAAYCVTCTPFVRQSAIYYSIYDMTTGTWSSAALISGTTITYTTLPRHQGLTLFSNGDGNAGLAANVLYVQSGSVDSDSESDQARKLQVARWQKDNGWFVNSSLVGAGCKPSVSGVMTNLSSCSHRPVGVIFPSGNTIVLFQEQDGLGHYHLSAVEFK